MEFEKTEENGILTYHVTGRVDSNTVGELEKEFTRNFDGVEKLVFDFDGLEYISSAGLRVLFGAYKRMMGHGKMTFRNVNEVIREIFRITGVSNYFVIER